MIGKKINELATELAPLSTDLTIIGDPTTGVSKKITLEQISSLFGGSVSFYTNLAGFPAVGNIDIIYCAKDTNKLYLWSGSAYTEIFPSQALLDTYQLRSEKGNANGYASLDSGGKVPISQLPSSIMEYKGTWNATTNTPTLANGTGDTGDVYICNVAGTVNFGAGPLTFAVGDYVIYSGTIWQRSSGAVGTVTSVAVSRSGDALAITGSPVTTSGTINIGFAGNSTQYINGAGNLVTFPGVINEAQNLITEVYNKTGATLTKGTVVYINGGQGNLPTITKALATGDSTSAQTYGIVRNDITNNNNGYVVVAGRISDLDTQAYTEGTQLYLSPTTAGTFTSTKPYAPNHLVYVGIVVRAHPTQGVIEVKIQNGYEMDELHNVAAQSPSNGDILQYVSATSLWTKTAGTTSNISEGSNLYYTDARSRAALSFTAGSGAYNSTTGVITIPTNTNQLTNGANYITLGSLSASSPLSYNNGTGAFSISQANTSTNGYLSSTDWNTFNGKQAALNGTGFVKISGTTISYDNSTYYLASNPNAYIPLTALSAGAGISYNNTTGVIASTITQYTDANARAAISLTTSGTSGAATYNSTTGVLNVPQYAPDLSGYVPTSRTLTINGTAYDLSANRSWSVGTVTSVGLSSATSGVTIGSTPITTSGTITLAIATASGSQQGLLSSTDWTTFNNKQSALTNPVTGTGTTNYLPKFTGASTIGNSLVFDNGTNVGIGTASPSYKLDIYGGTSGTRTDVFVSNAGGNYNIGVLADNNGFASTSNSMLFYTSASERMRITSSGNVGIGTTSPSVKLEVVGGTINNQIARFITADFPTHSIGLGVDGAGSEWGASIFQDDVKRFTIDGNGGILVGSSYQSSNAPANGAIIQGNVGIGTTSPSNKLHVVTDSSGVSARTDLGGTIIAEGSTRAGLYILTAGTSASNYGSIWWGNGNINTDAFITVNNSTRAMAFGTADGERMRITSGGNVGIGTTSPSAKLHVVGDGIFSSSTNTSLTVSSSGGVALINFTTGAGTQAIYGGVGGSNVMDFYTNSAFKMRLDASGNLGLGVTPSASSVVQLQVLNRAILTSVSNSTALTNNATQNSGYKYIASATATLYEQDGGAHVWYQAPSGTAGNAISFTQAMTLDASGNLALGGTSNKVTGLSGGGTGFTVQATAAPTIGVWDNSDASYYLQLGQIEANSYLWNIANGFLSFGTANTERMRLNASGNLGLGVTPSAWSAYTALQIKNSAYYAYSVSGIHITGVGSNIYYDGSQNKYISNGFASTYLQLSGEHRFYTAPSGTAGNNISLTQAMTLAANGNLLVGTTSDNGAKFQVTGGATFSSSVQLTGNGSGLSTTYGGVTTSNLFTTTTGAVLSVDGDWTIKFKYSGVSGTDMLSLASTGATFNSSIKTGEPDTGWGRAAIKIGARVSGTAFGVGGYLPVSVDGTVYYINLNSSTP